MISNEEKQYQSILDNLLDVSPNDNAVFTRVNNKFAFDFYTLFGPESFSKIYSNKNFDIPILEVNLIRICNLLEEANSYEEIKRILEENNIEVSDNRNSQLKKNPLGVKNNIINELKVNFQKQSLKWKLFFNKANEINTETNIWPMHLGFLFVKLTIDGKAIYGPLFLKEVYLEIRNVRPYLVSNGDIKVNEKLLFLLNNADFDLNISQNFGDWSIKDLIKYLHEEWRDIYNFNLDLNQPFKRWIPEAIGNQAIEFEPGVVLGLFQPSGGYARNRMLEIIKNKELNKILDIEFNKNIYKNRVKQTIYNPKTSIFKITPTNYSQDKAIASSLNQNTIIWGPPGTGKSQTIVNILTNLLVYGKSSLVCSQKKAALEVIKNRMGALKIFCLFMLNSKNMNKKNFYLPLREYLEYLENYDDKADLKPLRIINQKDIRFVNNIANFSSDPRFVNITQALAKVHNNWTSFSQEIWNAILKLPKNILYPTEFNFDDSKALAKSMLKLNKVKFKFWHFKNWLVKLTANKMFNTFKKFQGNLNDSVQVIKNLKQEDFEFLNDLINILPSNNNQDVSDEAELKKFIAQGIIKRINNFTSEEKDQYSEFAATIRLGTLEPYKFIKRFAYMIKKIFPIVIVTPEADLSAWVKDEFDYAILDESSQIFLEKGLPVLYLAKIKILAGDDQQMKPSNWFGVRVSDDESIYGKVDSLLDFAKSLGVYSVLLDKNYRSNYASLMTFSSKYFYKSTLDVIDSANVEADFKPIDVYEVSGTWENNQNVVEAELSIKLIKENINKYNKIILLCFNSKQQDSITSTIFKNHPELEKAINNGNLLLRNIENIQGDEADLVIVSIAYDRNTAIHSTYVGRPGGMNALNVAVSRAKDKMIVIKSLQAKDLTIMTGNEDAIMFKRWLEFLELSDAQRQNFLHLDDESSANSEQNIIDTKSLNANSSLLNQEIKNTILQAIKDKPYLKLIPNETLGTLKVDYVLRRKHEPILTFMIDDYNYVNNPEEFVIFKDLCKFIRSKKYTVYKLDRILWEDKKEEILQTIESIEPVDVTQVVEIAKEIPSSQLEILAQNNEEIKESQGVANNQSQQMLVIVENAKMLDINAEQIKNQEHSDSFTVEEVKEVPVLEANAKNEAIEDVLEKISQDSENAKIENNNSVVIDSSETNKSTQDVVELNKDKTQEIGFIKDEATMVIDLANSGEISQESTMPISTKKTIKQDNTQNDETHDSIEIQEKTLEQLIEEGDKIEQSEYLEREEVKVKSFEESKREWEVILTQEIKVKERITIQSNDNN
ncbi:DNA2/NAM7 family helicase [Mycoplasmopsis caviae]|uniref:DNA2/NAM7 family helicase n=1 Tax=Mycoplasmopsis caviae TaxID=55603 RepID=A0A3P8MDU6_9BACT|nr:DEAD/DEAH box helicase [Mycoplasmopsis caviae]UUD34907.1 DNA2/NAM7 family helicase [Mycoplasmopsis caviae]VDR42260.1 putative DNA helicase [Mycoplasmopsis caviae]